MATRFANTIVVMFLFFLFAMVQGAVAAQLSELRGTFHPSSDVLAEGQIRLPPGESIFAQWFTAPHDVPYSVVSGQAIQISINEWRWRSVTPASENDAPPASSWESHREFEIVDHSIHIASNTESSWSLQASAASVSGAFDDLGRCAVSSTTLVSPEVGDAPRRFSPATIGARAPLEIQCHSGTLSGRFPQSEAISLVGNSGTFLIDGFDQGREEIVSITVPAGVYSNKDTNDDLLYRNLVRTVSFRLGIPDGSSVLNFTGISDLRLQVPLFQWHGTLLIPPFDGRIQVGPEVYDGHRGDLAVHGTFLVSGKRVPGATHAWMEIVGSSVFEPVVAAPSMAIHQATAAAIGIVVCGAAMTSTQIRAFVRRIVKPLAWVVTLFTRISRDDALEHPIRQSIYDMVNQTGGIRVFEVCAALDRHRGTVAHHVRVLAGNDLIDVQRRDRKTYPLPVGSSRPPGAAEGLLRRGEVVRFLDFVDDKETLSQHEIADHLGVSQAWVSGMARRLERLGIIRRDRRSRGTRYTISRSTLDRRMRATND